MVSVFETVTRRSLRSDISFRVQDKVTEGTATAGASSTLTDDYNLTFMTADRLKGCWIYIHTGQGIGQERFITAQSTGGVVTITPNWTATPDTTSQYEIHRKFRIGDYNDAISAALRADRRFHVGRIRNRSLLTRNVLQNALFSDWTSGTSSAPDNWALSGSGAAVARNSDLNRRGPYAATLTNGSSNTLTFSQTTAKVHDGEAPTFHALVHCTVASRVTLKINDGVTTATSSDAHGGSGWEMMSVSHTVSPTTGLPSTIYSVEVSAGAAMSVAVAWAYVPSEEESRDYALPSTLQTLDTVKMARSAPTTSDPNKTEVFDPIGLTDWEVDAGSGNPSPVLRLLRPVEENRTLLLHGTGYPAIPTADTDTIEANSELLVLRAASQLTAEDRFERDYQTLKRETQSYYPKNSRAVGIIG